MTSANESNEIQASSARPARSGRWRKWLLRTVLLLVGLVIAAELVARFGFGLGNPPLHMRDDLAVYMFKPSQEMTRFGHHIKINEYAMRSDDFPKEKSSNEEVRVLMLGDSVINGGAPMDQREVVSELLQKRLAADLQRKVIVGNASEGGWGPVNELGWVRKYGFLNSDLLVLVLSSHDWDNMPDMPVGMVTFPDRKPLFALQEVALRYLPRLLNSAAPDSEQGLETPPVDFDHESNIKKCLAAVDGLMVLAQQESLPVVVALNLTPQELKTGAERGHRELRQVVERHDAHVVVIDEAYRKVLAAGGNPFRDDIHPNAAGHAAMAETLRPAILEELRLRGYDTVTAPKSR